MGTIIYIPCKHCTQFSLLCHDKYSVTRLLPELRGLSYPERLKALGITALETRRVRDDLIEVFKIAKGFVNIDRKIFPGGTR